MAGRGARSLLATPRQTCEVRHPYGMVYGMEKTTVYLPSELKRALERVAKLEGRSEADLIREGVAAVTRLRTVREPVAPLFASADPDYANRMDEYMRGFGED